MTFDDAARARVAAGWLNSSLDQTAYAAEHGISTRTLRAWVCRYGGGRRPHAQLRAAIVASIEQLQNVLAALDADAAAGSAAAAEDAQEVAERHAASEAPVTPPRATPVSPMAEPLASSTTRDTHQATAARSAAAVRDNEATGDEPEAVEVPAPAVAIVAGADGAPAPSCPAGRAVGQNDRRPRRGDMAAGVLDFEALRQRAAQRRAARGTSGTPRRNPFLDWDAE